MEYPEGNDAGGEKNWANVRCKTLNRVQGTNPLNVMILNAATELAGAEGVILNINKFIDPSRVRLFNCPFINFNRGRNAYLEELETRDIPYDAIPLERRFEFRYISAVRDLIRKYNIDIIHSHGYRSDVTALLAARGRIPVVTTVHGFTPKSWKVRLYELIQQLMFKQMDTIIAVSGSIEKKVLSFGISPEKIFTLPNIVDLETLSRVEPNPEFSDVGSGEDRLCMAYVGRLSIEKGLDVLINACFILKKKGIPFRLMIIGDGPLREKYESLTKAHGLNDHIRFLGFRRDAIRITAASDVLVLPSRTEGLPLVVLEAMAIGVPVVASRVGGLPELIEQHVNGILIDSGDVSGMADALVWLHEHREKAEEMGLQGRRMVNERYKPLEWAQILLEIYDKAGYRAKSKKRISILTNHPGQTESPTWHAHSTRIPVKDNSLLQNLMTAVTMFMKHWKYDCIVLGGGKSDMIYAILQTILPFGRKPCIMIDCLWYDSPTRIHGFMKRIMMRLVDKSVDRYIVWASREIEAYSRVLRLPKEKFMFIPYHTTLDTYELLPEDGEYLFSGGNYARDYNTLIDAVRGLPVKLLIACTRPELFKGISIPDNVTVQGFPHEEYLNKMAGCRINIVPLQKGLLHSGGQQTFLNSMFLGKPTIVSDPQGAKDYLTNWEDGVLVEPGDPCILRESILRLLDDRKMASLMGENAKKKVQKYSTEDHFKKIVALSEELFCNNK